MTHADRDIDGALNQKRGVQTPKVGDWEPSDESIGCWSVLLGIVLALALWGWILGILGGVQ